jgi:hypothetical protein
MAGIRIRSTRGGTVTTPGPLPDRSSRVVFLRAKTRASRGPVALLDQIQATGRLDGKRPVLVLEVRGRADPILMLNAADLPLVAAEWSRTHPPVPAPAESDTTSPRSGASERV